MIEFF